MRQIIYRTLLDNMSEFVSGEKLSDQLGVSRVTVSKAINRMKTDGAGIFSQNKLGHKLYRFADVPKPEYVGCHMKNQDAPDLFWYDTLDSTNSEAKKIVLAGAPKKIAVVAERQLKGRGRFARTWQSPRGKGIYCSAVLLPDFSMRKAFFITIIAALAVCRVLRELEVDAAIKWPNDIVVKGRKICGILCEMSCDMDKIDYIVCGFGLNVNFEEKDFPTELRGKATSLLLEKRVLFPRAFLLARILDELFLMAESLQQEETDNIMREYERRSCILGREVGVSVGNRRETGTVLGFDENGALLLERDGAVSKYLAGEVSIGRDGYV